MNPDALCGAYNSDNYSPDSSSRGDVDVLDNDLGRRYYTPNTLINKTSFFNELDYYFIQEGKKIQPDYIMAFRRNGKVENIDQVVAGAKSWNGELPVVIIDVDKCLMAERRKVEDMMLQYNLNKTPQIARKILQKVRNNQVTDKSFCVDIPLLEMQKWLEEFEKHEKRTVTLGDLALNSKGISAQEKKEGINAIKKLRERLAEKSKEGRGEDIEQ